MTPNRATPNLSTSTPKPSTATERTAVLDPGEGEAVWFVDHFLTVKADAATGAPFSLSEIAFPAGAHTPFHRHQDEDESFYVLEGELTFFLEGRPTYTAKPGAFLHVPAGAAHGFRTEMPSRMLVITGRRGFLDLARQAGEPAPRRELPPVVAPDLARIAAAATANGIELLGPLPSH